MSQHTPGPWEYCPVGDSDGEDHGIDHLVYARGGAVELCQLPTEADARLVAAAPSFYDAVTACDPEPQLWPVAYAESVLEAVLSGTAEEMAKEDPAAWDQAMREALAMCRHLRQAAQKAEGVIQ